MFCEALKACAKVGHTEDQSFNAEQLVRTMRDNKIPLNQMCRADLLTAVGERRYRQICRSCGFPCTLQKKMKRKVSEAELF